MRSSIQVVNDKILIDGELDVPEVTTPQPPQLILLHPDKQEAVTSIQSKIVENDPQIVKNSEFISLAVKVRSIKEVNLAYIAVAQRFPSADHIMVGYALKEDSTLKNGFCDDNEHGAGVRIRKTIFETKARNTAVFVVRKYGGIHLGYNRFAIIESISKQAIELLNTSS